MYLVRQSYRTYQCDDVPILSSAFLRWLRDDAPGVEIYRFLEGRFEMLHVVDKLAREGGECTLPEPEWRPVRLDQFC